VIKLTAQKQTLAFGKQFSFLRCPAIRRAVAPVSVRDALKQEPGPVHAR
jgi:hypothetical protein